MTHHNQVGSFNIDKARRDYEDLGPLRPSDVYSLLRQSDQKRRESLQVIYGRWGARYAMTEFKRLAKEL